jgi:hypothetical protein
MTRRSRRERKKNHKKNSKKKKDKTLNEKAPKHPPFRKVLILSNHTHSTIMSARVLSSSRCASSAARGAAFLAKVCLWFLVRFFPIESGSFNISAFPRTKLSRLPARWV